MGRKMKLEGIEEGNDSYRGRSLPTTPKRVTRSSAKRPSQMAKLSDRAPNSHKKQKKDVKPASVQNGKDETEDDGDTSGEYTNGTDDDDDESQNGGSDDDDEQLVQNQLASAQKEQQLKNDAKKREQRLNVIKEQSRLAKEKLGRLDKERQEKKRLEEERLETEQKKKLFRQQERLDMYNMVKKRYDQERLEKETKERYEKERLEKERKEARGQPDRQLAREQRTQKTVSSDILREGDENDEDSDGDEEDVSESESDAGGDENDDTDEEDGDEDESDGEYAKTNMKIKNEQSSEDDEDKDEEIPATALVNPANDIQNEDLLVCIRCIKTLAVSPIHSCDFTENPSKCTRCTKRGRNCIPVPESVHGAACKVLALQKQYEAAATPKSRKALRARVLVVVQAIIDQVQREESCRRKGRDDTYRAILFGQVGIKHGQEEILKLLHTLLSRGEAEKTGSALSGRGDKGRKRA